MVEERFLVFVVTPVQAWEKESNDLEKLPENYLKRVGKIHKFILKADESSVKPKINRLIS